MIILSLNAGSSTLKYSLYNINAEEKLLCEGVEEVKSEHINAHSEALEVILEKIKLFNKENNLRIDAVGCRVVHGGDRFKAPETIDREILGYINELKSLAPLHNAIDAEILKTCMSVFRDIPVVAVFDTAFHSTLPQVASTYAIPLELSAKYKLKKYGFHGIAHKYVSEAIKNYLPSPPSGLITCHLGNGASICAIENGKSIDTSMGLTPMEGLIMGTRCGDLDPGLILYLINECKIDPKQLDIILNNKSGMLGLSNLSSDLRVLQNLASENQNANLALEAFVYRIAKYIGAYYVALGKLDALVFCGGIGENSSYIREKICQRINCLGIELDSESNNSNDKNICITTKSSKIPVWVIHADENLEIAKQVYKFLE